MPYAHFLIPAEGGEAEERLRSFLRERRVLKVEQRFVDRPEGAYWAYAVHYDESATIRSGGLPGKPPGKDRIDYQEVLSESDFALYVALRDWRRDLAQAQGVPPFSIFHNASLAAIAEARPGSAEALGNVPGVGKGKVERHGEAVLAIINASAKSAKSGKSEDVNEPVKDQESG